MRSNSVAIPKLCLANTFDWTGYLDIKKLHIEKIYVCSIRYKLTTSPSDEP